MNYDIVEALSQIAKDKNIEMNLVVDTLKAGLLLAARKKYGSTENIEVNVDEKTGEIGLVAVKRVVEEVERSNLQISLEDAHKIDPESQLDDEIEVELPFEDFGRNAIQTAKQLMIQRVREAERERIYEDFQDRVGEIVTGTVQQVDRGNVIINLGRTEGTLPSGGQIRRERYRQGDTVRAFILDVQRTTKGPQIVLSRTHSDFLRKLFELEVPEIYEKIVEIKAIAREPGVRAKIAVSSADGRIDPVGACVGIKGSRIQLVVRELNNERIDVIPWSSDPAMFVTRALSPAKVARVEVSPRDNKVIVVVDDDQLSLAIGRSGQNARLAAKLTKRKIEILSQGEYSKLLNHRKEEKKALKELSGVGPKMAERLVSAGVESIHHLRGMTIEQLMNIPGVGKKTAQRLLESAEEAVHDAERGLEEEDERSE